MVTCKLWAQLANQLFMISATVCHALKMNTSFSIPARTINHRLWSTYIHHLPKAIPGRTTKHYFRQPDHSYTPIPDEDDITIEGYFQAEAYWHGYKENLADILGFKYQPTDYVAVHVRRGDYLQFPDRFPVLDLSYYIQAMEVIAGYNDDYCNFKIFSDDINWCKQSINYTMGINKMAFNSFLNISYSENRDPLSDMKEMFNASAFVIANSTFGLFPSLLRNDNPIVIAPAEHRWFGPNGQDMASKDRVPERFIKL